MEDVIDKMLHIAQQAQKNSYSPYSNFQVGCCIQAESGQFYPGTNVENAGYPSSQCAEASAVGAMVTGGDRSITAVVIVAKGEVVCPPCGNCRQILSEFCNDNTQIYLANNEKIVKVFNFKDLLPSPFCKANLLK